MPEPRTFTDAQLLEQMPRLQSYARVLTQDNDRARDLAHDTVVRAIEKSHLWRPGTNLRTWLHALCHNVHVDGVRHAARVRFVELDERNGGSCSPIAETRILANEVTEKIAGMPERARRLLALKVEGRSEVEMIDLLAIPIGTIRSSLFRSRAALREHMGTPA